jgi:hypothetical protein
LISQTSETAAWIPWGEVLGVSEWGGIKKKERESLLTCQNSETAANSFGFRGAKY